MMREARPTLLVVDDDRLVLATLVAGLKQAGYEVLEAENGDDAILLARQHRPRLALLDIRMEGKSGLDVARYLASFTTTGFLFLSAFSDRDAIDEAMHLGALGYLVKPLDIRQIVPAVEAALQRLDQRPAVLPAVRVPAGPPTAPGLGARPAPVAAGPAAAPPVPSDTGLPVAAQAGPDPVARLANELMIGIAIGILMERLRLERDRAEALLHARAGAESCEPGDLAGRLVQAANLLNRAARPAEGPPTPKG